MIQHPIFLGFQEISSLILFTAEFLALNLVGYYRTGIESNFTDLQILLTGYNFQNILVMWF